MLPDIESVAVILREVAAEEILPRYRDLAAGDVREKAPGDIVTVADEAAERVLTRRLSALLPGAAVLGEEAASADPAVLARLDGDAPVWVVDPLDGTSNFARGNSRWGMIVAYVHRGTTLAGWLYEPVSGRLGTAVRGEGAFLDGAEVRVAGPAPEMSGRLSSRSFTPEQVASVDGSPGLRIASPLWCAVTDYLDLASGQLGYVAFRKVMPWDHAAGVLLHAEAGGHAARFDGTPYDPVRRDGGLIVAPDPERWERVRSALMASGVL